MGAEALDFLSPEGLDLLILMAVYLAAGNLALWVVRGMGG